jgi:hypothetical protein
MKELNDSSDILALFAYPFLSLILFLVWVVRVVVRVKQYLTH